MAKRKAPQGPTAQPKGKRYNRSSTRQPTPRGIKAGDPKYGIKNTSSGTEDSHAARTKRLFGTGKFKTPSGQGALTSKTVKGQVK